MDLTTLSGLIVGPYGALIVMAVTVYVLYRENKALRAALDEAQAERLKDAKSAEMIAKAYLALREREKESQ